MAFVIALNFPISHSKPITKPLSQQALALGLHLCKNSLLSHTRHPNLHSHLHLNPMRHQSQSNQTLEPVQKLRMQLTIKSVFKKKFSHKERCRLKRVLTWGDKWHKIPLKGGAPPETS